MKYKELIRQIDGGAVESAIREAEKGTSGEIRVYVSRRKAEDPQTEAVNQFKRMGMSRTHLRNGVLIYVAPLSRNFAVIGDQGIHKKCGDDFWKQTAEVLAERFRKGDFTEGLVEGIRNLAKVLKSHFPATGENPNELSDRIGS